MAREFVFGHARAFHHALFLDKVRRSDDDGHITAFLRPRFQTAAEYRARRISRLCAALFSQSDFLPPPPADAKFFPAAFSFFILEYDFAKRLAIHRAVFYHAGKMLCPPLQPQRRLWPASACTIASALHNLAPSAASCAAAVLLPMPMLPVSPMTIMRQPSKNVAEFIRHFRASCQTMPQNPVRPDGSACRAHRQPDCRAPSPPQAAV